MDPTTPDRSARFPLLKLPAELRVKIYEYCIDIASILPVTQDHEELPTDNSTGPVLRQRLATSCNFKCYEGLLLSCKQVNAEFNFEWAAMCNARLSPFQSLGFAVPTITKICDTFHPRFGLHLALRKRKSLVRTADIPAIAQLFATVPSFTIYFTRNHPADAPAIPIMRHEWKHAATEFRPKEAFKVCYKRLALELSSYQSLQWHWRVPVSRPKGRAFDHVEMEFSYAAPYMVAKGIKYSGHRWRMFELKDRLVLYE